MNKKRTIMIIAVVVLLILALAVTTVSAAPRAPRARLVKTANTTAQACPYYGENCPVNGTACTGTCTGAYAGRGNGACGGGGCGRR